MSEEIWKDIPGYPNYQASTHGRIKSKARVTVDHRGYRFRFKERFMKPVVRKGGYLCINLHKKKNHSVMLHRLVAITFIPNPENKPGVNHINADKTDNRVENLEWATQAENVRHSWKMGLCTPHHGEKNHFAKLTARDVISIRNSNDKQTILAERYGVTTTTISNIKTHKSWKAA